MPKSSMCPDLDIICCFDFAGLHPFVTKAWCSLELFLAKALVQAETHLSCSINGIKKSDRFNDPAVLPLSFHCVIVHLPGIWPECGFEYKAPWTQQSWDIWQGRH